jgi:hypothetical protein
LGLVTSFDTSDLHRFDDCSAPSEDVKGIHPVQEIFTAQTTILHKILQLPISKNLGQRRTVPASKQKQNPEHRTRESTRKLQLRRCKRPACKPANLRYQISQSTYQLIVCIPGTPTAC